MTIKNKLELIIEELDDLIMEIEPIPQQELNEFDKDILIDILKRSANRADEIWHQLFK